VNAHGEVGFVAKVGGFIRGGVEFLLRPVNWILSITIRRPPGDCAGIGELPEGYHSNPVQCNSVTVTALDDGGGLKVYPGRSGTETLVRQQGGIKGFDAASGLESRFPPSTLVIEICH